MIRQILPYIAGAAIFVAIVLTVIFRPVPLPGTFERGAVTRIDNVYFGPYPTDSEFIKLKQAGVKRIISLLDERMPAEKS